MKVKVINTDTNKEFLGIFDNQESAQAWLNEQHAKNGFGPGSLSIEFIDDSLETVLKNRRKEYPSIDQIIHVLMDKGADSEEMTQLQQQRALVKAKYPKP